MVFVSLKCRKKRNVGAVHEFVPHDLVWLNIVNIIFVLPCGNLSYRLVLLLLLPPSNYVHTTALTCSMFAVIRNAYLLCLRQLAANCFYRLQLISHLIVYFLNPGRSLVSFCSWLLFTPSLPTLFGRLYLSWNCQGFDPPRYFLLFQI